MGTDGPDGIRPALGVGQLRRAAPDPRRGGARPPREVEREDAPLAGQVADADFSPVRPRRLEADRQAKTDAAAVPTALRVRSEQLLDLPGGQTSALILDVEQDAVGRHAGRQRDRAPLPGELERVVEGVGRASPVSAAREGCPGYISPKYGPRCPLSTVTGRAVRVDHFQRRTPPAPARSRARQVCRPSLVPALYASPSCSWTGCSASSTSSSGPAPEPAAAPRFPSPGDRDRRPRSAHPGARDAGGGAGPRAGAVRVVRKGSR